MQKYKAVYQAIKDDLYKKYGVGTFLPTEKELMETYHASRTTIRHAIAMLRDERLVEVRQGRGTQVLLENYSYQDGNAFALFHNVSDITSELIGGSHFFTGRGCVVDKIPSPDTVAAKLGVEPGTMIYRLERILVDDVGPFAFFKNYYSCELFPGLEAWSGRDELQNMYLFFEQYYGIYFESGQETITAQFSSLFDAKLLDMEPGMPLLASQRIAYTNKHEVMEYAERLIRPDRLRITVSMCGSPHYDDNGKVVTVQGGH